jgi:hypothetical protein
MMRRQLSSAGCRHCRLPRLALLHLCCLRNLSACHQEKVSFSETKMQMQMPGKGLRAPHDQCGLKL